MTKLTDLMVGITFARQGHGMTLGLIKLDSVLCLAGNPEGRQGFPVQYCTGINKEIREMATFCCVCRRCRSICPTL